MSHWLTRAALALFMMSSGAFALELRPASSTVRDASPPTAPIIHLGEEADWPPFTRQSDGIATHGLSYELMAAIFGKLGWSFDIGLYPQKRLLDMAKIGAIDGITTLSQNEERTAFVLFSVRTLSKHGLIYSPSSAPSLHWNAWQDLRGLRLGVVNGHNYGAAFDAAVTEVPLSLTSVTRTQQLFDMSLAGRLDAFFCVDVTAGEYLALPAYQGRFAVAEKPYSSKSYHLAISKKSPFIQRMEEINAAITALRDDGSLKVILNRYGASE